jgi:hypothetical protein
MAEKQYQTKLISIDGSPPTTYKLNKVLHMTQ